MEKQITKNLKIYDNFVYSYNAKVASIDHNNRIVEQFNWRWCSLSEIAIKHIDYVAKELGYRVIQQQNKD